VADELIAIEIVGAMAITALELAELMAHRVQNRIVFVHPWPSNLKSILRPFRADFHGSRSEPWLGVGCRRAVSEMDQAFAVFAHPQAIAAAVAMTCLLLALGVEVTVLLLSLRSSLARPSVTSSQDTIESYDWLYE